MSDVSSLIVAPGPDVKSEHLQDLKGLGIQTVFGVPDMASNSGLAVMYDTGKSTYEIRDKNTKQTGKRYRVRSNDDIDKVLHEASAGLDFVIVDVDDWKIIPLENTIAKLHDINTRLLSVARNAQEARKLFSILDIGVDEVILESSSYEEVAGLAALMDRARFGLTVSKVTGVREVGDGERACVDTMSMLKIGEGMLVGNRSNFLFLVHNEAVGSSFTSPRPFRVNAGAVHCYTLTPEGTTAYLSEMEGGREVLVVGAKGESRRATVGRSKIERRPMLYIEADSGDESGGIMAQNAETVRFIKPDGELISVTHLKTGDEILTYVTPVAGRHFGMKVEDEFILEK